MIKKMNRQTDKQKEDRKYKRKTDKEEIEGRQKMERDNLYKGDLWKLVKLNISHTVEQ